MRAVDAYGELVRIGRPIVETREAAARLRTSPSNTSHLLRSMEDAGLVRRLRRGLWALDPDVDPAVVGPYLTAPFPAYMSFWSALARHDMIEQIPRQVSIASLDRSRTVKTTLGPYAVHHLSPEIFSGFDGSPASGYLATPEKALFDSVYVRAPRGARMFFPELSLPKDFDGTRFDEWLAEIRSARLRTLVSRGLDTALAQAARDS